MAELSTETIVTFALIAVSVLLLGPILIYHIIAFQKIMKIQMIEKRYPKILLLSGILTVTWLIIGFPVFCIDVLEILSSPAQQEMIDRFNYAMIPWWGIGIFLTNAWRFWHMFYDLKNAALQETNWKKELDPELLTPRNGDDKDSGFVDKHSDFFIKNGATYGSKQWTKKRVAAFYFPSIFIIVFFYELFVLTPNLFIGHFVNFGFHFVIVIAALRLTVNIPSYSDHYFVKNEMKTVLYQLFIAPAFCTVAVIGYIVTGAVLYEIAMVTVATIMLFNVAMISFWWIPRKIVSEEAGLKAFQEENAGAGGTSNANVNAGDDEPPPETEVAGDTTITHNRTGSEITLPEKDAVKDIVRRLSISAQGRRDSLLLTNDVGLEMDVDEKQKSFDLPDIFYDDESFSAFMSHLAKDFSTEYLLCFVEMMQFKFLMKERFDIVDPNALSGTDVEFDIEYPLQGVAPMSEINKKGFQQSLDEYQPNDDPEGIMNESKAVCVKIYKKYIETGAEFKIKILKETKKTLDNLLKDATFFMGLNASAEQVFCIYDDTVSEVFSVLEAFPTFQTACESLVK